MKTITAKKIEETVARLAKEANTLLRKDVFSALKGSYLAENKSRPKVMLKAIIDNAAYAKKEKLAICQDTGLPIIFIELGQDVKIAGDLKQAVLKGIESGYKAGSFRESIIQDPLKRGKSVYSGAVIHTDIVTGNKLKITVLPKGFGCENKSQTKMFNPTVEIDEIKDFIINAVKTAGRDACPPYVVGVGIGGTADYAALLAKKALLREIKNQKSKVKSLEKDLLKEINKLNIGPMGLGGKTTALAVNIETYPTHIAGLPVAVNISCHALRSAAATL